MRGLCAGIEAQIPGLFRAHPSAYKINGCVSLEDPNAFYALPDTMMAYIHSPNEAKFVCCRCSGRVRGGNLAAPGLHSRNNQYVLGPVGDF